MTRTLTLAMALLVALAACGKVGPPVRTVKEPTPAAAPAPTPPVSTAPASSSAEQCDDPNAPKVEANP